MLEKVKVIPLGITLPIRKGNNGYFESAYDTSTQIKSNIINLLNTRPGERRMNPSFGTRLWNLVFEQMVIDVIQEKAKKIIQEDISKWISGVTITDVTTLLNQSVTNSEEYKLNLKVQFLINSTKQSDNIQVVIQNIIR